MWDYTDSEDVGLEAATIKKCVIAYSSSDPATENDWRSSVIPKLWTLPQGRVVEERCMRVEGRWRLTLEHMQVSMQT